MKPSQFRQHGVSLVEALVALAVMSIGLLGVVGMQATLRNNADVSRQRSEAVRLAQTEIERLRSFTLLDGAASGVHDFADIASTSTPDVFTPSNTFVANATFHRSVNVTAVPTDGPQMKTVRVEVQWWDRRADASNSSDPVQSIVLQTSIAKQAPELGATLGIPTNRSATQRPVGRNIAIPRQAIDNGDGTSTFRPSGSSGVSWVFNNDSGLVTRIGSKTVQAVFVTGFLRFATSTSQPTGALSEDPPSDGTAADGLPIVPAGDGFDGAGATLSTSAGGMSVETASPVLDVADFQGGCALTLPYTDSGRTFQAFYCAVPTLGTGTGGPFPVAWTGKLHVKPRPSMVETGTPASADNSNSRYRVCRYTPDPFTDDYFHDYRDNSNRYGVAGSPPTPRQVDAELRNPAHPLVYSGLTTPLVGQNYLLIRAGDGVSGNAAFTCPIEATRCSGDAVNQADPYTLLLAIPRQSCDSTLFVDGDTRYQAQP